MNECVQVLIIISKKVGWAKQGSCTLVDNEPSPPTVTKYASVVGGGNFLFPKDQLLLVADNGSYKPIESSEQRNLSKLHATKNYLVWYHHLIPFQVWKNRVDSLKKVK